MGGGGCHSDVGNSRTFLVIMMAKRDLTGRRALTGCSFLFVTCTQNLEFCRNFNINFDNFSKNDQEGASVRPENSGIKMQENMKIKIKAKLDEHT